MTTPHLGGPNDCSNPIEAAVLMDYWLAALPTAAEQAVESADKCVQELNQLRRDAHSDKAYGAAVAAVMGKAKILNLMVDQPPNTSIDFSSAKSMQDCPSSKILRHRAAQIKGGSGSFC